MKPKIIVSHPTFRESSKKLTKDMVFGTWGEGSHERLTNGMVVAMSEQLCPVFKDKVPYKSVTVICTREQEFDVSYWLEYVDGANSISKRKLLPDNKVALRSDYMCW